MSKGTLAYEEDSARRLAYSPLRAFVAARESVTISDNPFSGLVNEVNPLGVHEQWKVSEGQNTDYGQQTPYRADVLKGPTGTNYIYKWHGTAGHSRLINPTVPVFGHEGANLGNPANRDCLLIMSFGSAREQYLATGIKELVYPLDTTGNTRFEFAKSVDTIANLSYEGQNVFTGTTWDADYDLDTPFWVAIRFIGGFNGGESEVEVTTAAHTNGDSRLITRPWSGSDGGAAIEGLTSASSSFNAAAFFCFETLPTDWIAQCSSIASKWADNVFDNWNPWESEVCPTYLQEEGGDPELEDRLPALLVSGSHGDEWIHTFPRVSGLSSASELVASDAITMEYSVDGSLYTALTGTNTIPFDNGSQVRLRGVMSGCQPIFGQIPARDMTASFQSKGRLYTVASYCTTYVTQSAASVPFEETLELQTLMHADGRLYNNINASDITATSVDIDLTATSLGGGYVDVMLTEQYAAPSQQQLVDGIDPVTGAASTLHQVYQGAETGSLSFTGLTADTEYLATCHMRNTAGELGPKTYVTFSTASASSPLTLLTSRTFEGMTLGASATGANGFTAATGTNVVSNTEASEGTLSSYASVTPAVTDQYWGGFISADWASNGFASDEEFWVQFDCYIPSSFDWTTNSPMKFFRFRSENAGEAPYRQFTFAIGNGSDNTTENFRIDPESYATAQPTVLDAIMPAAADFARDEWVRFEFYTKKGALETARCWINNEYHGEVITFDTLGNVGSAGGDTMKFMFMDTFNGSSNSNGLQSLYMDNIKIANSSTMSPTEVDSEGNVFIGDSTIA